MEIIRAKFAGFCPGVKIAWRKVEKATKQGPIFILGHLIHNSQAITKLEKRGVAVIQNLDKLKRGDKVVIRAHGEPKRTYEKFKERGVEIIDGTCFQVKKSQKKASELEREGYQVIICGEKRHPEVRAIIGHTKRGMVVQSWQEAKSLVLKGKIALISQTTFLTEEFKKIKEIFRGEKGISLQVLETICDFTKEAQKEARRIGKTVDCLVVVGGAGSSNTKRLREVGEKICPTYHIETKDELEKDWFIGVKRVGLLAGASTPDWVINGVERRLQEL